MLRRPGSPARAGRPLEHHPVADAGADHLAPLVRPLVLEGDDADAIKEKSATLPEASMKLGEAMYKQSQAEAEAKAEAEPNESEEA